MKNLFLVCKIFRLILFLIIVSSSVVTFSQTDTLSNPKQYVFPGFSTSKVLMKSGKETYMALNYNIITEKLVFLQKGEIYDVVNAELIDTAFIQNRKFIPGENMFLEVVLKAKVPLFVQYKGKIRAAPKPAPYGGTTDIPSSTYVTSIQKGSELYKLKNDPNMVIMPEKAYWLNTNGLLTKFQAEGQLIKALPDYSSEIKLYVKKNKTKFNNTDEVLNLMIFCNSLMK